MMRTHISKAPKIIVVCCMFHNIAKILGDADFEDIENDDDHDEDNDDNDDINRHNGIRDAELRQIAQERRQRIVEALNQINE